MYFFCEPSFLIKARNTFIIHSQLLVDNAFEVPILVKKPFACLPFFSFALFTEKLINRLRTFDEVIPENDDWNYNQKYYLAVDWITK